MKFLLDNIAKRLGLTSFNLSQVLIILLLLVIVAFIAGGVQEAGADFYNNPPKISTEQISAIKTIFYLPIVVNPLIILLGFLFNVLAYHFVMRTWINPAKRDVFLEDFASENKLWVRYWGASVKSANIIHGNAIISNLNPNGGEGGMFYDVHGGIAEGKVYRVSCRVRSDGECTMGFRLWVHGTDTKPGTASNFPAPPAFHLPVSSLEELSTEYTANESKALRVHLHCKPGTGRIIIKEVRVTQL
ncbi:MAG TPA: hypothetical protein VK658_06645 [Chryseolinea sp.]|nr:hypothetical protein [Chryseolinea sp.]